MMLLQKCPFEAIMIINLPKNLEKETTHRYGPNSFKLHRHAQCHLQLKLPWSGAGALSNPCHWYFNAEH